jgi:hypothetical protein
LRDAPDTASDLREKPSKNKNPPAVWQVGHEMQKPSLELSLLTYLRGAAQTAAHTAAGVESNLQVVNLSMHERSQNAFTRINPKVNGHC